MPPAHSLLSEAHQSTLSALLNLTCTMQLVPWIVPHSRPFSRQAVPPFMGPKVTQETPNVVDDDNSGGG